MPEEDALAENSTLKRRRSRDEIAGSAPPLSQLLFPEQLFSTLGQSSSKHFQHYPSTIMPTNQKTANVSQTTPTKSGDTNKRRRLRNAFKDTVIRSGCVV